MPLMVEEASFYPVLYQEKETAPQDPPQQQGPRIRGARPAGPGAGHEIRYEGENAIWGRIMSFVASAGYPVRLSSVTASGDDGGVSVLGDYLLYKRQYVIDGESNQEWDTRRIMALVLYYLEPVICWLYRFLFVFPADMPFGDLIYFFGFLALAALAWAATKPNWTRVRGALMDIRISA
jgi:hypothetical protein